MFNRKSTLVSAKFRRREDDIQSWTEMSDLNARELLEYMYQLSETHGSIVVENINKVDSEISLTTKNTLKYELIESKADLVRDEILNALLNELT